MKILMHVCCAPDATTAYIRLSENHEVTFFFYNPNIHPRPEYIRRLESARKLAKIWSVKMIEGEYEPEEFFKAVRGYENLGEMSYRCYLCIKQRLFKTAELAKKAGYDAFSTSLPTSPKKSFQMVMEAGEEASRKLGVEFVVEDFKKGGGFPLSVKLSRDLGLYRQNYCGCIFSYREAQKQREESRKRRRKELEELLRSLEISMDFEMDPQEMEVDEEFIERIGMENFGKIVKLLRPRRLLIDKETYVKYWNGRKNARFGKFKVKLSTKEEQHHLLL